jgi:hypothetical protein
MRVARASGRVFGALRKHPMMAAAWLLLGLATACGDNLGAAPDAMPGQTPDGAADAPPYGVDLYVNGAFNDWGAPGKQVRFRYLGNGEYAARARLPAGLHLFKVTDATWSAERTFSANRDRVVTIGVDEPTALTPAPGEGNHTNIAVAKLAVYEFRLTADQDPAAPTLVVVEDLPTYQSNLSLQGSFNDWGSAGNELPLRYQGDDRYAVTVELPAGTHELRIAQGTDQAFATEAGIALGTETPLASTPATEASSELAIAEAGAYTFLLAAGGNPDAPTLLVRAAEEGEYVTKDPHRDAVASASLPGLPGSGAEARVSIAEEGEARTYALSSNQDQRRPELPPYVHVSEHAEDMRVRSGNLMFDGLFALALHEVRQARISKINDGSFDPVDCECFETGEQWHFVWTRDTAYAVDLSLALVDPVRAMRSLLFKTGDKRVAGDGSLVSTGPEIVQDTGSGGSWPISSDRVAWALGAVRLLDYLQGAQRDMFRDQVYEIFTSTIQTDRNALYDPRDGLYRGEQSFLDWREQTYPLWVARDVVHIGMAKALSTNVVHYAILSFAAQLAAEKGDGAAEASYRTMADELKAAINQKFWREDRGLYRSLAHTELDPAVLDKFDLLGQSLAILLGVADAEQASRIAASYPHTAAGAPVIWPQQPDVPIYHNRAIWPFVSAYALRAARLARNDAVVENNVGSLMRAAALNLSNMENLEFATGAPSFYTTQNPALGGPVLNSRRQLWSVAGYVSMVVDVVFGLETGSDGIRFAPFLTRNLRNTLFAGSDVIELRNLAYLGKRIDVRVQLPPADAGQGGYYEVASVTLNGAAAGTGFLPASSLADTNVIEIGLSLAVDAAAPITVVEVPDASDLGNQKVFAPREPRLLTLTPGGGGLVLTFDRNGETGTVFNVYRNGELVAGDLTATSYQDGDADVAGTTYCYAVEQVFSSSDNASHHSPPQCHDLAAARDELAAGDALRSLDGAATTTTAGITYFDDWGMPAQQLQVDTYTPAASGEYLVSTTYSNTWNHLSTGITGAVKWLEIVDTATGDTVAAGAVYMPQLPDQAFAESSYMPATLVAGTMYRITVSDYFNMSYLDFFALYHGKGGAEGPLNNADIAAVNVTRLR